MEEDERIDAINRLAELLIERGVEFVVLDERTLMISDGAGNLRECCSAGSEELVNVVVTMTPEEVLSVPDLDGIVVDDVKLRALVSSVLVLRHDPTYEWLDARLAEICGKGFTEQAREVGIEEDE